MELSLVEQECQVIKRCHAKTHETPMLIYILLKIYSVTRSGNLIDMPFSLGLCISYDRVLEITKNIYEIFANHMKTTSSFFLTFLKWDYSPLC